MAPRPSATDVLILGARGRVGDALTRLLPRYGLAVRGASRTGTELNCVTVDVGDEEQLTACIETLRPRTVIYSAAVADPDQCERDPATSYEVNVRGADRTAAAAARFGCRVVYYSSDYVFGAPGTYFEDAPVSPLQTYGRHKSQAEQLVLSRGDNVVVRLPLLFGNKDFVADAVAATIQGTPLAVDDRTRYPIPIEHVVEVAARLLMADAERGVYHAVGSDGVTKSEWANFIADLLGKPVPPVAAASGVRPAQRPVDVELATRHPETRTQPETLWTATRARVAELRGVV